MKIIIVIIGIAALLLLPMAAYALTGTIGPARTIHTVNITEGTQNIISGSFFVENRNTQQVLITIGFSGDMINRTTVSNSSFLLPVNATKTLKYNVTITQPGDYEGDISATFSAQSGLPITVPMQLIIHAAANATFNGTQGNSTTPPSNNTNNSTNSSTGGQGFNVSADLLNRISALENRTAALENALSFLQALVDLIKNAVCSIDTFSFCSSDSSQCTNECSLSGTRVCSASTSYRTCGNFDTDTCLELGPPNACAQGQSCSNGQCTGSACLAANATCDPNNDQCCGDCIGRQQNVLVDTRQLSRCSADVRQQCPCSKYDYCTWDAGITARTRNCGLIESWSWGVPCEIRGYKSTQVFACSA